MRPEIVLDTNIISRTLSEIETLVDNSRTELDEIILKNKSVDSYGELNKSKNLIKMYGECADDYAKLCYLQTGVTEAILDLRTVRKVLTSEGTAIPQSLVKSYKYRIDTTIEQLNLFKDAIQSSRLGLEARVRFFNSCSYTSYDKVIGAKC